MSTQVDSLDAEPSARSTGESPEAGRRAGSGLPAVTVIRPAGRWQLVNARELWRYRELIGFLTWRDVKVRYKQTLLGAAWAILQPVLMMVVFTLFFSRMAGVSSGDVPYPLFAYAGLLPWTFFATAVTSAGNSIIGSERLITKVYFPRLAIPFAAVGAAVVDFFIACGLLVVLMLYYGITPGVGMLLIPFVFIPILLAALGVGTLLAALNVSYRDFRYVIPFLVQLWMFATPTVYMEANGGAVTAAASSTRGTPGVSDATSESGTPRLAPKQVGGPTHGVLSAALALNPMTGLIGAFRAAALGKPVPWGTFGIASACSALALLAGCLYFRKVEDSLADVI